MKKALLAIVFCLICSQSQAQTLYAHGDSITKGEAVTTPFPAYIAGAKGWSAVNNGVNGAQAADIADSVYALNIDGTSINVIAVGINDARTANGDATKKAIYASTHLAELAFSAFKTKLKADSPYLICQGFASVGGGQWGWGKWSNVYGESVSGSVSGSVVYVGYTARDTMAGTFTVTIDGANKGTFSNSGGGKINTVLGRTWTPQVLRFGGLASGTHSVVITNVTSGTGYVHFDWMAGTGDQSAPLPSVYVGNITRMSPSGYTTYGGSDTVMDDYNRIIMQNVMLLSKDGLAVFSVNSQDAISPATDLADGIHPTQAGYNSIGDVFLTTLR